MVFARYKPRPVPPIRAIAIVAVEFAKEIGHNAFRNADAEILHGGFDQAVFREPDLMMIFRPEPLYLMALSIRLLMTS